MPKLSIANPAHRVWQVVDLDTYDGAPDARPIVGVGSTQLEAIEDFAERAGMGLYARAITLFQKDDFGPVDQDSLAASQRIEANETATDMLAAMHDAVSDAAGALEMWGYDREGEATLHCERLEGSAARDLGRDLSALAKEIGALHTAVVRAVQVAKLRSATWATPIGQSFERQFAEEFAA